MEEINFEKEMPVGLAMSLALNENAMEYYTSLDFKTREDIQEFVKSSKTDNEAKEKIDLAIENLNSKTIKFLM
ncbi:MAG: hypothetical protein RSA08_02915 [Clostridia bacterium]